ncbi:hypothetical protein [Gordonia iterans]
MNRTEVLTRFTAAAAEFNPATMTTTDLLLVVEALETACARLAGPKLTVLPGGAA